MECVDTFLMPAPGGRATPHLSIVVTTPDALTCECVIVSVTTLRNSKDQTIILRPGDHAFIRHDSTIFYGEMIADARILKQEQNARLIVSREKCPPQTLKLAEDGIGVSPFTRPRFLRFCRGAWAR